MGNRGSRGKHFGIAKSHPLRPTTSRNQGSGLPQRRVRTATRPIRPPGCDPGLRPSSSCVGKGNLFPAQCTPATRRLQHVPGPPRMPDSKHAHRLTSRRHGRHQLVSGGFFFSPWIHHHTLSDVEPGQRDYQQGRSVYQQHGNGLERPA
ncbi:hypothetical protein T484DRAFT_1985963 [Baffinella frigidus]|nr:hypothetical protein T484DRAFT_1985963 [Cryptophyta sp. CCMP2293]